VAPPRLGHAFSVHGISGNLGWALAPVFLIGVAGAAGTWRGAYAGTAVLGAAVLLLLVSNRGAIDDRAAVRAGPPAMPTTGPAEEHPMAFLRLPSVWLCFSFFFWSTAALSAIQSFASPALGKVYGLPLGITAFVVTAYMLCGVAGMVAGGFVAARESRIERTIALAMAFSAVLLLAVATGGLPPLVAAAAVALAGAGTGFAGPSRDMLIKRASPPGATGRVYGTVYSGLDVGFALSAPVFGWLLDHQMPGAIFAGAAAMLGLGIGSAGLVAWRTQRGGTLSAARA
jgi:predicted MFS family arabinose efflux permease